MAREVTVIARFDRDVGSLERIWRSLGYDEINWTYTQIGKQIYREIRDLNDGPYWMRNHNAFTSGNGISSPAWGSTDCYREDDSGAVSYDWTLVDRVYDTMVENNVKPMIELAFMPHPLSTHPETGPRESWRYPPKDYGKWSDLVAAFVKHVEDRYGAEEVRTWYFSTWNEADINYFKWKPDQDLSDEDQRTARDEEFFKLHDHSCAAVWSVDEKLRVGGPDLAMNPDFLDRFLDHCHNGKNYVTGKTGSRLDFISLHVKGTRMDSSRRVKNPDFDLVARRRLLAYWERIKKYERFTSLPIIGNEWDIDVGTVLGIHDSPDWEFRNNSYFPTFIIREMKELDDVARQEGINLQLVMQWTFYFHGKRCFEGHRAIFDPMGIRKPVFNGLAMLAKLGATRIETSTDDEERDIQPGEEVGMAARRPKDEQDAAELRPEFVVQPHPQVDALATRTGTDRAAVIVWNQVCDQYAEGSRDVAVRIEGLDGWERAAVEHYRIDAQHSNAHTVWEGLGRPDWPTEDEIAIMKRAEKLEKYQPDRLDAVVGGQLVLRTTIPVHGVSMYIVRRA
jgi:xylan 1,4-beta-xylosidase